MAGNAELMFDWLYFLGDQAHAAFRGFRPCTNLHTTHPRNAEVMEHFSSGSQVELNSA